MDIPSFNSGRLKEIPWHKTCLLRYLPDNQALASYLAQHKSNTIIVKARIAFFAFSALFTASLITKVFRFIEKAIFEGLLSGQKLGILAMSSQRSLAADNKKVK